MQAHQGLNYKGGRVLKQFSQIPFGKSGLYHHHLDQSCPASKLDSVLPFFSQIRRKSMARAPLGKYARVFIRRILRLSIEPKCVGTDLDIKVRPFQ